MRQIFLFPFFFSFFFFREEYLTTQEGKDCSTWTRADQWSRTREDEQKIAEKIEKRSRRKSRQLLRGGESRKKKRKEKKRGFLPVFCFGFLASDYRLERTWGGPLLRRALLAQRALTGGAPGWEGGWEPQTPALFPLQVSGGSVSFRLLKQLLARRIATEAKLKARLTLLTSRCWWSSLSVFTSNSSQKMEEK